MMSISRAVGVRINVFSLRDICPRFWLSTGAPAPKLLVEDRWCSVECQLDLWEIMR